MRLMCGVEKRNQDLKKDTKKEERGRAHAPLKLLLEWLIIQEDPRVVVPVVELFLHFAHNTQGAIDLPVVREHDQRRIFTLGER
jgi:hypothetical protein